MKEQNKMMEMLMAMLNDFMGGDTKVQPQKVAEHQRILNLIEKNRNTSVGETIECPFCGEIVVKGTHNRVWCSRSCRLKYERKVTNGDYVAVQEDQIDEVKRMSLKLNLEFNELDDGLYEIKLPFLPGGFVFGTNTEKFIEFMENNPNPHGFNMMDVMKKINPIELMKMFNK